MTASFFACNPLVNKASVFGHTISIQSRGRGVGHQIISLCPGSALPANISCRFICNKSPLQAKRPKELEGSVGAANRKSLIRNDAPIRAKFEQVSSDFAPLTSISSWKVPRLKLKFAVEVVLLVFLVQAFSSGWQPSVDHCPLPLITVRRFDHFFCYFSYYEPITMRTSQADLKANMLRSFVQGTWRAWRLFWTEACRWFKHHFQP